MNKIIFILLLIFSGSVLLAQNNVSEISQIGTDQFAKTTQEGTINEVLIQQVSENPQFVWVFQSGETPGGEDNDATVDQRYSGNGNQAFLYQFGSFNQSFQKQEGSRNAFNIEGGDFLANLSSQQELPEGAIPNQDGDYHQLSQIAKGDDNQAWMYQSGRMHGGSQFIEGNENQIWTSQSGNEQNSTMIINGNQNGSHFLEHGEGKFPHDEDEEDSEHSVTEHGKGNSGNSGGHSTEGGKPSVIPPPHDEDHVFVATVGVAIKQMGKGSNAEMYIEGDDNKALIIQRGGDGGQEDDLDCEGGHYVDQDIYGNWNRIFADQRGTNHTIDQFVSGSENLVTFMQKGNGSLSELTLIGNSNEIGVDQKGKDNVSDVDVTGNFNGNFTDPNLLNLDGDEMFEYGVKLVQEGKGNNSDIDILGDCNFIAVHQGGGASSTVNQDGDWNTATVTQASLDEH